MRGSVQLFASDSSLQLSSIVSNPATRRKAVFEHLDTGSWKAALNLIQLARESSHSVHPAEYTAAISACAKHGRWQEALKALDLLEADLLPTNDGRTIAGAAKAYTRGMAALGRAGKWQEACDLLDRMNEHGVAADTRAHNAALSACGRAGQVGALFKGLRDMAASGVPPDAASYSIVMDGCAKAGMHDHALRLFERMGHNGTPHP